VSASPDEFLKARAVAVQHDEDWTAGKTIYAHYCRWAYLTGSTAGSKKSLLVALRKRRCEEKDINGVRIYSVSLLDPVLQQERAAKPRVEDRSNGAVAITRDLKFVDGVLGVGTVVEWLRPTEAEAADLEVKKKRLKEGAESSFSWLVVRWQGKRRRVSGDSVERV
jgi:hypothetical protein